MAVYTEVSLSEAQELFQPLGKIIEFEGIKEGVENTNYLVKLSDNKKIIFSYLVLRKSKKFSTSFNFQLSRSSKSLFL